MCLVIIRNKQNIDNRLAQHTSHWNLSLLWKSPRSPSSLAYLCSASGLPRASPLPTRPIGKALTDSTSYTYRENKNKMTRNWRAGEKRDRCDFSPREGQRGSPSPRHCHVHFLFQPYSKNISPHLLRDGCCHGYCVTDAF